MSSATEQLSSLGKSNLDAALKFATRSIDCTERLFRLRMNAATEMVNANNENLRALASKPETVDWIAYWQVACQTNAEKTLEVAGRYFAEFSKAQVELTQLLGEQVTSVTRNAIQSVDTLAKSVVSASEEVVKAGAHGPELAHNGRHKRAA